MSSKIVYMDHAATSWPKPPEVARAMVEFLEKAGSNPGRSAHRLSQAAGRVVYATREQLATFFNASDPLRVIFTENATAALNLALRGLLKPGDHVVTSSLEHNAVMRPLRALEAQGVKLSVVSCTGEGTLDLDQLKSALACRTKLVVSTHASNVVGTILPIAEIAGLARRAGALLLVDAAQTAGCLPIDVEAMEIDLLAFAGHKGLHGPPGTGGLVLGARVDPDQIEPLVRGGTGSRSESQEQPTLLPDKFESGTPNSVGIAGLAAGVSWVSGQGLKALRGKEQQLVAVLRQGLAEIPGVKLLGPREVNKSVAVLSFTVAGKQVSTIGRQLDDDFGVLCRVGLHCAPAAHQTLGTFPEGTVRLAPGPLTTLADVQYTLAAVAKICGAR